MYAFRLTVAIGLFGDLGMWAMTHDPIHMVQFIIIIVLVLLLLYSQFVVLSMYIMLKVRAFNYTTNDRAKWDYVTNNNGVSDKHNSYK